MFFPFLRIWIVIPTFSASSKVTFLIEKQYATIIKVVFCITSRETHFEACTSDFYYNKRIKKCFCNSREGINSVLLPFLCTWIVIPTFSYLNAPFSPQVHLTPILGLCDKKLSITRFCILHSDFFISSIDFIGKGTLRFLSNGTVWIEIGQAGEKNKISLSNQFGVFLLRFRFLNVLYKHLNGLGLLLGSPKEGPST